MSHIILFWSSLQIVDNDQVVLTSSFDHTVRLWSARGECVGAYHLSIALIPDMNNVPATLKVLKKTKTKKTNDTLIKVKLLYLLPSFRSEKLFTKWK